MRSLAKGFLRTVCGNFAEICKEIRSIASGKGAEILRKVCGNFVEICKEIRFIASGNCAEILRKVCGNFAEICGKFSAMTPSRTTP